MSDVLYFIIGLIIAVILAPPILSFLKAWFDHWEHHLRWSDKFKL